MNPAEYAEKLNRLARSVRVNGLASNMEEAMHLAKQMLNVKEFDEPTDMPISPAPQKAAEKTTSEQIKVLDEKIKAVEHEVEDLHEKVQEVRLEEDLGMLKEESPDFEDSNEDVPEELPPHLDPGRPEYDITKESKTVAELLDEDIIDEDSEKVYKDVDHDIPAPEDEKDIEEDTEGDEKEEKLEEEEGDR